MEDNHFIDTQKKLEVDIWIISLVTLAVFGLYAFFGNQLMNFVVDKDKTVIIRLLVNAGVQFGIAGLGILIVKIIRKEKFMNYGLKKKNTLNAIVGTLICFLPFIAYIILSGQFEGYQPLSILISKDILESNLLIAVIGMLIILIVWGFFEGFNYVFIAEKINKLYPSTNKWLDYGALCCAIICILFHPFSTSFLGLIEILTTFIAIYGMLIVKKKTGNAWGCVFAFCFIWNAF